MIWRKRVHGKSDTKPITVYVVIQLPKLAVPNQQAGNLPQEVNGNTMGMLI